MNNCQKEEGNRKSWMPFLAALQIAVKTKDEILFQNNSTTNALKVPSICEPFAVGSSVKDKLKKSRQQSFGPLVHLLQLKRLSFPDNKNKSRLSNPAKSAIKARLMKVLGKQTIGQAQKKLLNEIESGNWEVLNTLCLSYCSIKPHIEHNFVLTYPYIWAVTDFHGANFTDRWVWDRFENHCSGVIRACPDASWREFMFQIDIHCIFQTSCEDFGVLREVFGRPFLQRKNFGKYSIKNSFSLEKNAYFAYKVWTKPQKGAPRNINSGLRGQIVTRVSLRGGRATYNAFTSLEELESSYMVAGSTSYTDAIQKEFEAYMDVKIEGTGGYYDRLDMLTPDMPAIV